MKLPYALAWAAGLLAATLAAAAPAATGGNATTTATAPASTVNDQMQAIADKINLKLQQSKGVATEKDLAGEIKQMDDLFAAHQTEKTDDVAGILVLKATLYAQVFRDFTRSVALLQQAKTDFPDTAVARQIDGLMAEILMAKIEMTASQGDQPGERFAEDFKQIEAIAAAQKDPNAAAVILVREASLYSQALDEPDQAIAVIKRMQETYPKSDAANQADQIIAALKDDAASAQIRRSLVLGAPFPDFSVKDLQGQPLSVADAKAKVLLVDFWATWCGPCLAELPNVEAAYQKYHAQGFDIIGVSLDDTDPKVLTDFLDKESKNGMTWPQYYDGKNFQNALAVKYGVKAIPSTYLLDANGKIIGKDLRGGELDAALAKALAK